MLDLEPLRKLIISLSGEMDLHFWNTGWRNGAERVSEVALQAGEESGGWRVGGAASTRYDPGREYWIEIGSRSLLSSFYLSDK